MLSRLNHRILIKDTLLINLDNGTLDKWKNGKLNIREYWLSIWNLRIISLLNLITKDSLSLKGEIDWITIIEDIN